MQLHEFEALTLCNARDLSVFFDNERAVSELRSFVQRFKSPEQINEGEETSPSKRIIAKIPEYDFMKTTAGSEVAAANGIEYLLERCPHFADWIAKLVDLPNLEWKSQ